MSLVLLAPLNVNFSTCFVTGAQQPEIRGETGSGKALGT